jgi:hypothetical protein
MKAKVLWLTTILASLALLGASFPALGQEKAPGKTAPQALQREANKLSITGKVDYLNSMGGYFIQGQKPPEVFIILNQNAKVLAELAKSGKVVKVEATVAQGDNILIETIDGKKYQGKQKPVFK